MSIYQLLADNDYNLFAGSLSLGDSGTPLSSYSRIAVAGTASGPWASPKNLSFLVAKIGGLVSFTVPAIPATTATVATLITFSGVVPAAYLPTDGLLNGCCTVTDNSIVKQAIWNIDPTTGVLTVGIATVSSTNVIRGNFTASGTAGTSTISGSWVV